MVVGQQHNLCIIYPRRKGWYQELSLLNVINGKARMVMVYEYCASIVCWLCDICRGLGNHVWGEQRHEMMGTRQHPTRLYSYCSLERLAILLFYHQYTAYPPHFYIRPKTSLVAVLVCD